MAKIIIILEDEDTATSLISAQVIKFNKLGELDTDTPAKALGFVIERALKDYLAGRNFDAYVMPMQSTAQN
ncbi:MAG: hypothetical protein ACXWT0_08920 [Methylobacter sp.]